MPVHWTGPTGVHLLDVRRVPSPTRSASPNSAQVDRHWSNQSEKWTAPRVLLADELGTG
jgi:hypothetical protein